MTLVYQNVPCEIAILHPFQVPVGPIVSILSMEMAKITIFWGPWIPPPVDFKCPFNQQSHVHHGFGQFRPLISAAVGTAPRRYGSHPWCQRDSPPPRWWSQAAPASSPSRGSWLTPGAPRGSAKGFFDDWYMLISYVYICVLYIYITYITYIKMIYDIYYIHINILYI